MLEYYEIARDRFLRGGYCATGKGASYRGTSCIKLKLGTDEHCACSAGYIHEGRSKKNPQPQVLLTELDLLRYVEAWQLIRALPYGVQITITKELIKIHGHEING